jgi:hypothetical protein
MILQPAAVSARAASGTTGMPTGAVCDINGGMGRVATINLSTQFQR